jgi:hypothetical protein
MINSLTMLDPGSERDDKSILQLSPSHHRSLSCMSDRLDAELCLIAGQGFLTTFTMLARTSDKPLTVNEMSWM